MKKTIISGPVASGKTWISYAIENTHKNIVRTTAFNILENGLPPNISDQYSCIIIDACSEDDIYMLDKFYMQFSNVDVWSGRELPTVEIPIVYITQAIVTQEQFGDKFHVINCSIK